MVMVTVVMPGHLLATPAASCRRLSVKPPVAGTAPFWPRASHLAAASSYSICVEGFADPQDAVQGIPAGRTLFPGPTVFIWYLGDAATSSFQRAL